MTNSLNDVLGDAANTVEDGSALYNHSYIIENFDPEFYLSSYIDVFNVGMDPFKHFYEYGYLERRYKNEWDLLQDYEIVKASGLFDAQYYQKIHGPLSDPIRHYLINSVSPDLKPSQDFDPKFFLQYYKRTLADGENAFTFYCKNHHAGWCWPNFTAIDRTAQALTEASLFDEAFVRANMPAHEGLSPAQYFVAEGHRLMDNPSEAFFARAYLAEYPDIASNIVNPLMHYQHHGAAEGRKAYALGAVKVTTGRRARRHDLPTIAVVCHEASRTGAPLVGLNLIRELCGRFNIVAVMLRGGVMADLFSEFAIATVVTGDRVGEIEVASARIIRDFAPQCAVLNSMESAKFASQFARAGMGIISLIHEFAHYVHPIGTTAATIALSDRVIFPAELVRDSALLELKRLGFDSMPTNTRIRHQGRSIVPHLSREASEAPDLGKLVGRGEKGGKPFVVLGAGWVQMRKGVDLFIEAARVLKHDLGVDCRFLWVGANYKPFEDMGLSVYLADQIVKSDLSDVVVMVEEQATLAPFMEAADAFFMSSRLDPFPNVGLDAISEGVPLLCFEGGCGISELASTWPKHISAIPYGDARSAAIRMAAIAKAPKKLEVPAKLREALSFRTYADDLAIEIGEVIKAAPERAAQQQALMTTGEFNATLYSQTVASWMRFPGLGAGVTVEEQAGRALRAARAGLPVALVRPDRLSLLQSDGTWASASHLTARRGATDNVAQIVVATDDIGTIETLARRAYATPGGFRVNVVTRKLEIEDLEALYSVLEPKAIAFTQVTDGAESAAVQAIVAGLGAAAFECARPTAEADWSRIDTAIAFAGDPDLALVVQSASRPIDHKARLAKATLPDRVLPRALLDPDVCWVRTRDVAIRTALAAELVRSLDPTAIPNDWIAVAAGAGLDVARRAALVRDDRQPARGYALAYGRDPAL
jgi:glycosyltransferase involved in cell wall biosynthesis